VFLSLGLGFGVMFIRVNYPSHRARFGVLELGARVCGVMFYRDVWCSSREVWVRWGGRVVQLKFWPFIWRVN
jgi:hypothetical protein